MATTDRDPTNQNSPSAPMVAVDHVTRRYGDVVAVDDASFSVETGKFLTILGPSGSGKSTILRMIAGFDRPSSGEVFVKGRPVSADPPYKRSIGMVFQRLALFPHMTAAQNIAYPLRMRRLPQSEVAERVERFLAIVHLEGHGDRRIHQLSGGQQQRVAIARALVFEPDLLLLDEPLASLDKKLREDMQLEFRRIQRELSVTTVNVTHDQREALVMSDDVIVMNEGRINQCAVPVDTYRNPATPFVAGFIGVTNFLAGSAMAIDGDVVEIKVASTRLKGRSMGDVSTVGDNVDCALRAEQIRIAPINAQHADLETVTAGQVVDVIFEGDRTVYGVVCDDLDAAMLRVFDHDPIAHTVHAVGDRVVLGWNRDDVMVFPRQGKSPN